MGKRSNLQKLLRTFATTAAVTIGATTAEAGVDGAYRILFGPPILYDVTSPVTYTTATNINWNLSAYDNKTNPFPSGSSVSMQEYVPPDDAPILPVILTADMSTTIQSLDIHGQGGEQLYLSSRPHSLSSTTGLLGASLSILSDQSKFNVTPANVNALWGYIQSATAAVNGHSVTNWIAPVDETDYYGNLSDAIAQYNSDVSDNAIFSTITNDLGAIYERASAFSSALGPKYPEVQYSVNTTLTLGSVFDSLGDQSLIMSVPTNQKLILSGDNYFAALKQYTADESGNISLTGTTHSGTYAYAPGDIGNFTVTGSAGAVLMDNFTTNGSTTPVDGDTVTVSGGDITGSITYTATADGLALDLSNFTNVSSEGGTYYISYTDGFSPVGIQHDTSYLISGPYGYYHDLGTMGFQDHNGVVEIRGLVNGVATTSSTYTIYLNTFFSSASGATLDVESSLVSKNASVGTFGNIMSNDYANFTSTATDTVFSNTWSGGSNNEDISAVNLTILGDSTILDPSITWVTTIEGIRIGQQGFDGSPTLTIKPSTASWASADYFGISSSNTTSNNFTNNEIYLQATLYQDSTLLLDSSGVTDGLDNNNDVHFNVCNPISAYDINGDPADMHGNVILRSAGNNGTSHNITIDDFGTHGINSLGYNDGGGQLIRLNTFTITGSPSNDPVTYGTTSIVIPVYSYNITLDSAGAIYMLSKYGDTNVINDMGDGHSNPDIYGVLQLNQDVVATSVMRLHGTNTTINLGVDSTHPAILNAGTNTSIILGDVGEVQLDGYGAPTEGSINASSNIYLDGDIVINTYFSGAANDGAGKGGTYALSGNGTTLDLSGNNAFAPTLGSGVTSITIKINHDDTMPASDSEFSYFLFGLADDNAQIIMPSILPTINLIDTGTPYSNTNITWNLDTRLAPDSGVVSTGPSTGLYRLYTTGNSGDNGGGFNGGGGNTPTPITPPQETRIIAAQASASVAANNAISLNTDIIRNTIFEDVSESDGGLATEDIGIASGDSTRKRGVWVNGFAGESVQKNYSDTVGYKSKIHGFTIGADAKINDTITAGAAWSRSDSIVKHKDGADSNKAASVNNIFSLYGLKSFGYGWTLHPQISVGLGKTKSVIEDSGAAHYKSEFYRGLLELSKTIILGQKNIFQPTAGCTYYQYKDRAHNAPNGLVNAHISPRKNYSFEGLLGGKFVTKCSYGDWVIKPQASAYAHFNLKSKRGNVHISQSPSVSSEIHTTKANSAWYSGGVGVFAYKGSLEAGLTWEMQLDKKYVGHSGSLKVRLNF